MSTADVTTPDPMTDAPVGQPGPKRVYLHIGAPKTGTTMLQNFLWHNRYELSRQGICYPLRRAQEHYGAGMDVRNDPPAAEGSSPWAGMWENIAGRIRDWPGPLALFSGEYVGAAAPDRIAYALSLLEPAEVHLIVTARDLARQIPSDWQEQVKHRRSVALTEFTQQLIDGSTESGPRYVQMFWRQHDPTTLLSTWSQFVPASRIHLVTVPPAGARRELLVTRFLSVLGIDLDSMCLVEQVPSNPSLGAVEAEYLRRVNPALRLRLQSDYAPIVRDLVAENLLAARPGQRKIELPRAFGTWARRRSDQIVDELRASEYDVVGDLGDLIPTEPSGEDPQPLQQLGPAAMMPVASDVVAGLLVEVTELRSLVDKLQAQVTASGERPARRPSRTRPVHAEHGSGPAYVPEDERRARGGDAEAADREPNPRRGAAKRGAPGPGAGNPGAGKRRAAKRAAAKRTAAKAAQAVPAPPRLTAATEAPPDDYVLYPEDDDGDVNSVTGF